MGTNTQTRDTAWPGLASLNWATFEESLEDMLNRNIFFQNEGAVGLQGPASHLHAQGMYHSSMFESILVNSHFECRVQRPTPLTSLWDHLNQQRAVSFSRVALRQAIEFWIILGSSGFANDHPMDCIHHTLADGAGGPLLNSRYAPGLYFSSCIN